MEKVDRDKSSKHILKRCVGLPLESPRHPISATKGCFYSAHLNKSLRHSFWLLNGFVILIQRQPVGLSPYGLSAIFVTFPAKFGSQANSCLAKNHAGPVRMSRQQFRKFNVQQHRNAL
jgi:hypothetical protein